MHLRMCVILKVQILEKSSISEAFPYYMYIGLLFNERICSLGEQILSLKRSPHFKKGRNRQEILLVSVVCFDVRNYAGVLATPFDMFYNLKV